MAAADPELTLRQAAGEADAVAASRIIDAALEDLLVKRGRAPLEDGANQGAADEAAPALAHLMRTDPGAFWVAADADDRPVGFGAGMSRPGLWLCSGLFVLPEHQGKGLGRRLFELAKSVHPLPGEVAALTSSAANPISNRLYGSHGVYPQVPLLSMTGSPGTVGAGDLGTLETEPLTPSASHLADLTEIDAGVTGVDRTVDHRWHLEQAGHEGWLFRRRERAIGYAYLGGDGTEGAGAVGPIATLRAADQEPVLRFALAELAARRPGERALVIVPGPNLQAQRLLWQAGFRFEDSAGLLCASRPFGRFDRYLLAGDCLM
jgi:GNAT superfamily N-acetyltransferase